MAPYPGIARRPVTVPELEALTYLNRNRTMRPLTVTFWDAPEVTVMVADGERSFCCQPVVLFASSPPEAAATACLYSTSCMLLISSDSVPLGVLVKSNVARYSAGGVPLGHLVTAD